MSTVLYAFRASSEQNLHEQIGIMKYLTSKHKFLKIFQLEGIDIQIFRTSLGIIYRVLEDGYSLKNLMWEDENVAFFPPCNYDNRSDMDDDEEKNKHIADLANDLVLNKDYSIEIIVEPIGEVVTIGKTTYRKVGKGIQIKDHYSGAWIVYEGRYEADKERLAKFKKLVPGNTEWAQTQEKRLVLTKIAASMLTKEVEVTKDD